MTQYSLLGGTGTSVALAAVTYTIRIVRIDLANNQATVQTVWFDKYTGGTLSGTAFPIVAMRAGSPAATASAKSGSSISGTRQELTSVDVGGASWDSYTGAHTSGGSASLQPPLDLTFAPGTAFKVNGLTDRVTVATIYFEELRL